MSRLLQVWTIPAAVAAASAGGLAAALLLGGDVARAAACLALSAPVGAFGWACVNVLVQARKRRM